MSRRRRGVGVLARAVWPLVVVLGAAAFAWVSITALPGDAATRILGPNATPERLAALRERIGLDQPVVVQFVDWLTGVLTGDLGTSAISGAPITALVLTRLGNSLVLAVLAALIAVIGGVALGALAGRRPASRAGADAVLIAAGAVPDFVIGSLAVGLLAVSWRLLPALSMIGSGQHPLARPEALVIPVCALATPVAVWIARYTSAAVAQHIGDAHVHAARLLGVPEWRVLLRHVLPVALMPVVPLFGWMSAVLVGSTVVVEQLVEYPGIGSLLVEAVGNRDITLVSAIVTVLAAVIAVTVGICDVIATRIDTRSAR